MNPSSSLPPLSIQSILITILIHSTQYIHKKPPHANSASQINNRLIFIQHLIQKSSQDLSQKILLITRQFDAELHRFLLNSIEQICHVEDLFMLMEKNHDLLFDRHNDEDTDIWSGNENSQNNVFRIEHESFFGLILRRYVIQFEEMMFDEVSKLFDDWKAFKVDLQQNLETYATDEVEAFIHYLHLHEDFSNLEEIEKKFPQLPKVHYLKYLRAMKHKNWEEALESLHRYFDYCHVVNTARDDQMLSENSQSMIASYAGLNLAALYFHFGYYESAVYAIKETIRIAQQKGEEECLSLSLAWLFRLENKNPSAAPGSSQETMKLVQKCIQRCKHLHLPQLLAETLLFSAQLMTSKQISTYEEDPLSLDPTSVVALPAKIEYSVREAKIIVAENNLPESLARSTESTQAASWREFGFKEFSNMHQIGGEEAGDNNSESQLVYLIHQAHAHADQGNYTGALQSLCTFPGDVSINTFWYRHTCDIVFDHALRKNQIHKARSLLALMKRIASPEDSEYLSMILCREAKLELSLNNARRASQLIEKGIEMCQHANLATQLATMLHVDASIEIHCKSPLKSLRSIMEGISVCEKRSLILKQCEFQMLLAETHLARNSTEEAFNLLENIFPHVLENASAEIVGRIFLLAAKVWHSVDMLQHAYEHFESVQYLALMLETLQLKHKLFADTFSQEDEQRVLSLHSELHSNATTGEVFEFGNSQDAKEVLRVELERSTKKV